MKTLFFSLLLAAAFSLNACSNSSEIYYWGDFNEISYEYAEQSITENEYIKDMLTIEKDACQAGKQTPPGFNAELATMYLKQGNKEKAAEYYKKESQAFPESTYLMSTIVENLTRNNSKDSQTSQTNNPAK